MDLLVSSANVDAVYLTEHLLQGVEGPTTSDRSLNTISQSRQTPTHAWLCKIEFDEIRPIRRAWRCSMLCRLRLMPRFQDLADLNQLLQPEPQLDPQLDPHELPPTEAHPEAPLSDPKSMLKESSQLLEDDDASSIPSNGSNIPSAVTSAISGGASTGQSGSSNGRDGSREGDSPA